MGCTNVGKSSLFNAFLQSDLCKVQVVDLIQRATISPWPGTTLNLLKVRIKTLTTAPPRVLSVEYFGIYVLQFPVTRPESWRISLRRKRLSEDLRSLAEVEANRESLLRQTRNPVYATLVGHIGRTFQDPDKLKEMENFEGVRDIFRVNPFARTPNPVIPKRGEWDAEDPQFVEGKWCFDTPGAVADNQVCRTLLKPCGKPLVSVGFISLPLLCQILDQLTLPELMLTLPKEIIVPRTYILYPGMSFFVGGLARLDYKETFLDTRSSDSIRLIVFTSQHLPINVVETEDADEVYREVQKRRKYH